nr:MAG TPA: hypothetical protein [Caudoviricetes sp.]
MGIVKYAVWFHGTCKNISRNFPFHPFIARHCPQK